MSLLEGRLLRLPLLPRLLLAGLIIILPLALLAGPPFACMTSACRASRSFGAGVSFASRASAAHEGDERAEPSAVRVMACRSLRRLLRNTWTEMLSRASPPLSPPPAAFQGVSTQTTCRPMVSTSDRWRSDSSMQSALACTHARSTNASSSGPRAAAVRIAGGGGGGAGSAALRCSPQLLLAPSLGCPDHAKARQGPKLSRTFF